MSVAESVTIRVSEDTWTRLNQRKGPGDSFDDVVAGLLDEVENESTDS